MNYYLYENPFYIPYSPYGQFNMGYNSNSFYNPRFENTENKRHENLIDNNSSDKNFEEDNIVPSNFNSDIFSITEDRLQVLGFSINTDDLIILVMLFFMLKEGAIDYSLIIILAFILFDQS